MVSSGFAAKGTLLTFYNQPVLELTNIGIPVATADDVDITNHDSAFDYEEFVPGILRGGDFEVEGNYLPTDDGQKDILDALQARTYKTCQIIGPAGKYTFTFSAYPKKFAPTAPVEGKTSVSIGFKVSGKSTLTATTSTGFTTPFFALRDNGGNAVTPSPAAATAVYQYAATLDSTDTHVAIQPHASDATSVFVNGTEVTSGNWSSDIAVAAGTTKQITVVVNDTGKASKVYRIFVERPV